MAKKKKKQKRRLKKGVRIFFGILITVFVAFGAMAAVIAFVPNVQVFPIKTILVAGENPYSTEQVIEASGLLPCDTLFRSNIFTSSSQIESQLPYVKRAKITYKLNGTVTLHITRAEAVSQIQVNGAYYLLDDTHRILEKRYARKEKLLQYVGLILPDDLSVGQIAIQTSSEEYRKMKSIQDAAEANGDTLTVIDVSDPIRLAAVYDDRLYLDIGTSDNLVEKFRFFHKILGELEENESGKVMLNQWSTANRKISVISENTDEIMTNY